MPSSLRDLEAASKSPRLKGEGTPGVTFYLPLERLQALKLLQCLVKQPRGMMLEV